MTDKAPNPIPEDVEAQIGAYKGIAPTQDFGSHFAHYKGGPADAAKPTEAVEAHAGHAHAGLSRATKPVEDVEAHTFPDAQ